MNSDLTFITPLESVSLLTGQANLHTKDFGVGANEKNQTLLDRFRALIKDTRFFDVLVCEIK